MSVRVVDMILSRSRRDGAGRMAKYAAPETKGASCEVACRREVEVEGRADAEWGPLGPA